MTDVTRILARMEQGEAVSSEELLPLVYEELRRLAAAQLSHERPGNTLQATDLVHAAFVRLVDGDQVTRWDSRGHFFAAAAIAMRRILIEAARHKLRRKHGGGRQRAELPSELALPPDDATRLIELDEALTKLAAEDELAARVVQLHFFAGQSLEDVGRMLGLSRATAYRQWAYARSWLACEMG